MNPINVICWSCGIDTLVEPEIEDDLDATCSICGGYLYEQEEELKKLKEELKQYEDAIKSMKFLRKKEII